MNPQSPDALVRALISGPGSWLRPAVLDALPAEVQSLGTWVDADGVAHVNLSEEIEALTAEQERQSEGDGDAEKTGPVPLPEAHGVPS